MLAMKRILPLLLLSLGLVSSLFFVSGCGGGEAAREEKRLSAVAERQAQEAADIQARAQAERAAIQERRMAQIIEFERKFEAQRPTVVSQVVVRLISPGEMFGERSPVLRQKLVSMLDPLFPGVDVVSFDPMTGPVSRFSLGVVDVTVQGTWRVYDNQASPKVFSLPGGVAQSMAMQVYFPPELPLAASNGVVAVAEVDLPDVFTNKVAGSRRKVLSDFHYDQMGKLESECLSKLQASLQPVPEAAIQKKLKAVKPLEALAMEGYELVWGDRYPDSYDRSELIAALEHKLGRGRVFEAGSSNRGKIGTIMADLKKFGTVYGTEPDAVVIPDEAELKLSITTTGGDPDKDGDLVYKAKIEAPSSVHIQNLRETAFFQTHALLQELARRMMAK